MWKEAGLDMDELEKLYVDCEHLAYAEQRFDSRSQPMTRLLKNMGRVVKVLQMVSQDQHDAHRDDRLWACHLMKTLSGTTGFARLSSFAVETDYIVSCRRMTRLQDKSDTDVSMAQHEVVETLMLQEALFQEGRIFSAEKNESYCWELLNSIREHKVLFFGNQERADIGWPA